MTTRNHDAERLGELLSALPTVPAGVVAAAQELPRTLRELDRIVELAEADAEFRRALVDDLETALRASGYEPNRTVIEELRRRFPA
ncbi:MAG: hypothetical protein H0T13_01305 [Actinobacteria bacterium]|nr:hypothetical protein [Actinomycetota bacterium]